MKTLKDFKKEINKCSKCGLCQSVCPVYKITGNDCAVSRGKFVMLDGVLKGDLKLNKNIEKYLDLCLKCGKCKDFCPSNIDVCEIFNIAKYECAKNTFHGKLLKFLESKLVFGNVIHFFRKFPFTHRYKIISQTSNPKLKVIYFKGCVNEVYPKVENALKKIFSNLDIEIIEKDFDCCGLPFLSSGNMERYEQAAKHNIELLNGGYDYVLTDCASCAYTLSNYKKYFKNINLPPIINAGELLAKEDMKFVFEKPVKITFHKPCHLENDDFIKLIFQKCENIEYIEMEGYDDCCGFAGEFAIKNPKISKEISKKKITNALKTEADYIITTCPACVMGLAQGLIANKIFTKKSPKILNLMEFLANAKIIKS